MGIVAMLDLRILIRMRMFIFCDEDEPTVWFALEIKHWVHHENCSFNNTTLKQFETYLLLYSKVDGPVIRPLDWIRD